MNAAPFDSRPDRAYCIAHAGTWVTVWARSLAEALRVLGVHR